MINKDTAISELPERYKLIAYCYSCEEVNSVNLSEHSEETIESMSHKIHCPTCHAQNMGIRPVVEYRRFNLIGSLFSSLKHYWKKQKLTV